MDNTLDRLAIEELIREVQEQKVAGIQPPQERKRNPLGKPNKHFLGRTINSAMTHNNRQLLRTQRNCRRKLRELDKRHSRRPTAARLMDVSSESSCSSDGNDVRRRSSRTSALSGRCRSLSSRSSSNVELRHRTRSISSRSRGSSLGHRYRSRSKSTLSIMSGSGRSCGKQSCRRRSVSIMSVASSQSARSRARGKHSCRRRRSSSISHRRRLHRSRSNSSVSSPCPRKRCKRRKKRKKANQKRLRRNKGSSSSTSSSSSDDSLATGHVSHMANQAVHNADVALHEYSARHAYMCNPEFMHYARMDMNYMAGNADADCDTRRNVLMTEIEREIQRHLRDSSSTSSARADKVGEIATIDVSNSSDASIAVINCLTSTDSQQSEASQKAPSKMDDVVSTSRSSFDSTLPILDRDDMFENGALITLVTDSASCDSVCTPAQTLLNAYRKRKRNENTTAGDGMQSDVPVTNNAVDIIEIDLTDD